MIPGHEPRCQGRLGRFHGHGVLAAESQGCERRTVPAPEWIKVKPLTPPTQRPCPHWWPAAEDGELVD